jgi:hypothetical protein
MIQRAGSRRFEQFSNLFYRQPVQVRILQLAVGFHAPQILFRCRIIMAVYSLDFTAEAKHKINLPVGHVQQIKIGSGIGVSPAMKPVKMPGILFKLLDF